MWLTELPLLDHMARGRIYFGIGSGGPPIDTEMFDTDLSAGSLRERMMESIEVILKMWEGKSFEYNGRFLTPGYPRLNPTLGWAFT